MFRNGDIIVIYKSTKIGILLDDRLYNKFIYKVGEIKNHIDSCRYNILFSDTCVRFFYKDEIRLATKQEEFLYRIYGSNALRNNKNIKD